LLRWAQLFSLLLGPLIKLPMQTWRFIMVRIRATSWVHRPTWLLIVKVYGLGEWVNLDSTLDVRYIWLAWCRLFRWRFYTSFSTMMGSLLLTLLLLVHLLRVF
jgi:hypothetical protein